MIMKSRHVVIFAATLILVTRGVDAQAHLDTTVIVAYPTSDAPFTYFVEVYKRTSDSEYSLALRYRGHTGYGDGNPLAVVDSEMPETLRRLGLLKTGDALPAVVGIWCRLALLRG